MDQSSPQPSSFSRLAIMLVWFAPLLIMAVLIVACNKISNNVFTNKISEGVIEYKISFPDVSSESITASLLPETMTYAFNKNSFASHFESAGGVFQNRIVGNYEKKTVNHQLKVFRKKVEVHLDESGVLKMLADYPSAVVIETQGMDTIAGYPCKKALIVFEQVDLPEIEVFYTTEIEMNSPNWCTPYHKINGVLMAYEIEEFGIRMRLEALNVNPTPPTAEMLVPEPDYSPVSKEMMDIEVAQLVETFEL